MKKDSNGKFPYSSIFDAMGKVFIDVSQLDRCKRRSNWVMGWISDLLF